MKTMPGKKQYGLEKKKQFQAYKFVSHWVIGLVLFFIVPIFESLRYSFSNVTIESDGLHTAFAGLEHFKEALILDPDYLNNLRDSIATLAYTLPLIISLSLILAVILNQQFVGCTVARVIFFMPVIISTSVIMTLISGGGQMNGTLFNLSSGSESAYGNVIDFEQILSNVNLPASVVELISTYLSRIFSLIWDCGIQTILFLAGLQNISPALYEVSKIEGANKWEEFWFVTVPMLRHIFPLVIIYTMIEIFTSVSGNLVMNQIYDLMSRQQVYDLSSAMLWLYFVFAFLIVGLIVALYNRFCMKRWE